MKKVKGIVAAVVLVLAFSITALTAYAVSVSKTPAEALADLTGSTAENVLAQRAEGKTYGAIANEADVLDEFKVEMLEIKKAALQEKVTDGSMTQETADEIIASIEKNQTDCDGTGSRGTGCEYGAGFGGGFGWGNGQRNGQGNGRNGSGCGMRNGSCQG